MQLTSTRFLAGMTGVLILAGLAVAPSVLPDVSVRPAMAQQAPFTCTEVIGFSQTAQWYQGGFSAAIPDPADWQLRWYSGGSVDFWADPNFAGWQSWSQSLYYPCGQNSATPDRVVMNVSGDYHPDPTWWAQETHQVILNIQAKYPNVREIALQPVVGGPGGGLCPTSDPAASQPWVRASYNYPYIKQGLAMDVGGQVVLGASPEVRTCSDYLDWAGHLSDPAAQYVGGTVAQFWAPSSSSPTPTSTVGTVTPTATAMPGTQTVTFDDLGGGNRALTGWYPAGLMNWGASDWWLSGPYGKFTTYSISFNGAGLTSASFTFASPHRLVRLDAYNGGTGPSTITFSCDGTVAGSGAVGAGQIAPLVSSISGTCTTITLGSSNGWSTNFDNLVIDTGPTSPTNTPVTVATNTPTATATPIPAASATPTATATAIVSPTPTATSPSAGTQSVITFDTISNPGRPLTGTYPNASVDWGSNGNWWVSGPYHQFKGNSVSFNGAALQSATINFPTGMRVVQLDADNGGTVASTISVSCAGLSTVQATLAPNQMSTLSTGWTVTCSSVMLSSTNGWDTNFNNIVLNDRGSAAPPTSTPIATSTATATPTSLPTSTPTATATAIAGACPCSIWASSAAPTVSAKSDANGVEVGLKFQSDRSGFITGIRFYKGVGNNGTHVGNLWTSTGTLLASATFTGESASGWQQVTFASPVAITAGTTYVASYYAPLGHYAADQASFTTSVDRVPLHGLASGTGGGNGVYAYGTASAFPTSMYNATNYWVDVVFHP